MKRKLTYCLLFILAIVAFESTAQRGNNWVSGRFGGMDFNHTPPKTFLSSVDGHVDHNIGDTAISRYASVISDCNGELLFYSDGSRVWNKEHEIMPEGNLHQQQNQINLIIPVPDSTKKYFLFYPCAQSLSRCPESYGLYYSVIDMTLDEGKGDVDTTNKNNFFLYESQLSSNTRNQMTVIPHENNKDWWLISYVREDMLHAFHITENGIADTVISHGIDTRGMGSSNFTPSYDGNKIVTSYYSAQFIFQNDPLVKMFDFDRKFGIVHPNYKTLLKNNNDHNEVFDAAFSPNDSFVYLSTRHYINQTRRLYRVNRYDNEPYLNKQLITTPSGSNFGGITLGPDHKLYISKLTHSSSLGNMPPNSGYGSDHLNVVHYPNHPDPGKVQYESKAINFSYPQLFSYFTLPVVNFPVRNIEFTHEPECRDTAVFNNLSGVGIKNFEWRLRKITDSLPYDTIYGFEPHIIFPESGQYLVTLAGIDTSDHPAACQGYINYTDTVDIYLPPYPGFKLDTITYECNKATIHLQDTSANATAVYYDFGDGVFRDTFAFTYDSSGIYPVRQAAINAKGCADTVQYFQTIEISSPPVAGFTVLDSGVCTSSRLPVENASTGADSLRWLVNNQPADTGISPDYTIDTSGIFKVSLISYNDQGCPDTLHKPGVLTAIPPPSPVISYTQDTFCMIQKAAFEVTSENAHSYSWYISGVETDSGNDLHYSFIDSGIHEVMVIVENPYCVDTAGVEFYAPIEPHPEALFSTTDTGGCAPHEVNFINQSSHASSFLWQLNGPQNLQSTNENSTFTLTETGMYDSRLIAHNNQDCTDTFELVNKIEVLPDVIAGFETENSEGCEHVRFHLYDRSEFADSWHWDFGDETSSKKQNPFNVYRENGQFHITQIASNRYCSDTASTSNFIDIISAPRPEFSVQPDSSCVPFFTEVKNVSEGDIIDLYYTIGSGDTINEPEPSLSFETEGTYMIRQHLTSSSGCNPVDSTVITAFAQPRAEITITDTTFQCEEQTFYFQADTAAGMDYYWEVSGKTKSGYKANFTFSESGTYQITLISGHEFCRDTTEKKIEVAIRPASLASFYAPDTTVCLPGDVRFKNESQHADAYGWYFGSGAYLDVWHKNDVEYRYTKSGLYSVKLIAASKEGCMDTLERQYYIEVTDSVRAAFNYSPESGCKPLKVSFNNQSESQNRPLTYQWYFDTGDSSNELSPQYVWDTQTSGIYTVILEASNGFCSDTAMAEISVSGFDGNEPAPVLNRATVKGDNVLLEWEVYADAEAYAIYKGGQENQLYYTTTRETTWTDVHTNPQETIYHYYIRAQDNCGLKSNPSDIARNIRLKGNTLDNGHARLDWNPYRFWPDGVREYVISRRDIDESFNDLHVIKDTAFIDESFFRTSAHGYCYRVKARASNSHTVSISNEACLHYEPSLYIPNAFSPNGDGLNDVLEIVATGIEIFNIRIYNRWGQELYHSEDLNEYWNGTVNGRVVPEGVYFYSIHATGVDGNFYIKNGTIKVFW